MKTVSKSLVFRKRVIELEKILEYFPQAQEQSNDKNKILVFEQDMQQVATKAHHEKWLWRRGITVY